MLKFNFFGGKNQGETTVSFLLFFGCQYISTLPTSYRTHENRVSSHDVVHFVTEMRLFSTGLCKKKS